MTFVESMIFERHKRHWNRQRVADKIGVHVNTLGRWESGADVPLSMAMKWAEVFGAELTLYMTVKSHVG